MLLVPSFTQGPKALPRRLWTPFWTSSNCTVGPLQPSVAGAPRSGLSRKFNADAELATRAGLGPHKKAEIENAYKTRVPSLTTSP